MKPAPLIERYAVFNDEGLSAVGRSCNVKQADGSTYVFADVGELWMHPRNPDACTMRKATYDDGLVKSDLSDCTQDSVVYDADVVDSVSVRKTLGSDHCVIKIKSGLDASMYQGYEKKLRDQAVLRSNTYIALLNLYNQLVIDYANLQIEHDKLVVDVRTETDAYNSELTNLNLELQRAAAIRSGFAAMDADIANSTNSIAAIQQATAVAAAAAEAAKSSWNQVNGQLVNISVSGSKMCGTTGNNDIFCADYNQGNWNQKSGKLAQLSIDGQRACGVNSSGNIYCADNIDSPDWTPICGTLTNISLSGNVMCGTNSANNLFCAPYKTSAWVQRPGTLRQISINGQGGCATTPDDDIFCSNSVAAGDLTGDPAWYQVAGKLRQVSVSSGPGMCGVNGENRVFCANDRTNGNWALKDGSLSQLSLDGNNVCGVSASSDIFCSSSIANF